jgi:hypothetical protein
LDHDETEAGSDNGMHGMHVVSAASFTVTE